MLLDLPVVAVISAALEERRGEELDAGSGLELDVRDLPPVAGDVVIDTAERSAQAAPCHALVLVDRAAVGTFAAIDGDFFMLPHAVSPYAPVRNRIKKAAFRAAFLNFDSILKNWKFVNFL